MPRKKRVTRDEDAMDEDDEPQQAVVPAPGGARRAADDGIEEEAVEKPPPFDPKAFQHKAISNAMHTNLKPITDSWDAPKQPLHMLEVLIRESATMLLEVKDDADPMVLKSLDKSMREVVDLQSELEAKKQAALDLRQQLTTGDQIVDPAAVWQRKADELMERYQSKTSRQRYAKNPTYMAYRDELWGVTNEGAMPPLNSIIPREAGDESDDEDIEVGGMVVSLRDPITKGWLENPVKSKKCGHSYSKASMADYLRTGPKKCPAAGCGQNVSKDDLVPDENIARQVRNAKRREKEQARGKGRNKAVVIDSDDEIVE